MLYAYFCMIGVCTDCALGRVPTPECKHRCIVHFCMRCFLCMEYLPCVNRFTRTWSAEYKSVIFCRFERLYQPFLRGNMRTPAGDDEDSSDLALHLPRQR